MYEVYYKVFGFTKHHKTRIKARKWIKEEIKTLPVTHPSLVKLKNPRILKYSITEVY